MQAAFEAAQRRLLEWGRARAPHVDRLVLSGGCALNVTANGRILQSGLFSEIIAPPAPHDAGCAVGAALARGGAARNARSPYLGPGFTDAEIARAFADRGLPAPRALDEDALIAAIVEALVAGDIVGWFQGGAEFGPRALGRARSSPIRATTPSARRSTPRSRSVSFSAPSPPRRRSRRRRSFSSSPTPAPT